MDPSYPRSLDVYRYHYEGKKMVFPQFPKWACGGRGGIVPPLGMKERFPPLQVCKRYPFKENSSTTHLIGGMVTDRNGRAIQALVVQPKNTPARFLWQPFHNSFGMIRPWTISLQGSINLSKFKILTIYSHQIKWCETT